MVLLPDTADRKSDGGVRSSETKIEQAPLGSRYTECYDPKTRRPHKTYVALYNRVCEEIAGMGLEI